MVNVRTNEPGLWGRNPQARQALVKELAEGVGVVVTRKQVLAFLTSTNRQVADVTWLFNGRAFRAGRGQYTLQPLLAAGEVVSADGVAIS